MRVASAAAQALTRPELLAAAVPLARQAARRLMELRETPLSKERKADHSIVTNADREADRLLRDGLRLAFPSHAILTEESGLEGRAETEFVWVVDPLDGTRAYVHGRAGFSVMVGLLREGRPYAGIVVDPCEGHLFEAVVGHGAYHELDGRRTRVMVSARSDLGAMPVITSTGFPHALQRDIQAQVRTGPWLEPVNSVGIKVGYLVRRLADIYINHHAVHYWDTCAPQVILEEAGGCFTYTDGSPLVYDLSGNHRHPLSTLATNNRRHAELIQVVRPLFGAPEA
ncbi:MAG TPA: 3'(2'),5'-bisphosphate nucleotidase CysQ [Elusimicrobiota bacterium]|nr:3'(2'),5'-bisphosphate nucleotidase CysQ [Elusimicrobiota bacterium]